MGNNASESGEELSWMENSEYEEESHISDSVSDTTSCDEEKEDHGGVVLKSSEVTPLLDPPELVPCQNTNLKPSVPDHKSKDPPQVDVCPDSASNKTPGEICSPLRSQPDGQLPFGVLEEKDHCSPLLETA